MITNRSLNITVDFVGSQDEDGIYSGTATYIQTDSCPPMKGVVAEDGTVDLGVLVDHPDFHLAIGMHFTLNAQVTDRHGVPVPCIWAIPLSQACVILGPGGGPPKCMTVSQTSFTDLMIANANDDLHKDAAERTYEYKLWVMLPSVNNYLIGLDPQIVNTGRIGMGGTDDEAAGTET